MYVMVKGTTVEFLGIMRRCEEDEDHSRQLPNEAHELAPQHMDARPQPKHQNKCKFCKLRSSRDGLGPLYESNSSGMHGPAVCDQVCKLKTRAQVKFAAHVQTKELM